MLVGYARTSTGDQRYGLEHQQEELRRQGCEKIFAEHASTRARQRPQLEAALEFIREGDTLVVWKLDRLARSTQELMRLADYVRQKGAELKICDLDLDTGTANGKLILTVMSGIAEFERSVMLERQREGIRRAQAEGKYKGRVPTARRKAPEVERLIASGAGVAQTARRVGISRMSVYRILRDAKAEGRDPREAHRRAVAAAHEGDTSQ